MDDAVFKVQVKKILAQIFNHLESLKKHTAKLRIRASQQTEEQMKTFFLWQGLLVFFLLGCETSSQHEQARTINQLVQNLPTRDDKTKAEVPKNETKTIPCDTKEDAHKKIDYSKPAPPSEGRIFYTASNEKAGMEAAWRQKYGHPPAGRIPTPTPAQVAAYLANFPPHQDSSEQAYLAACAALEEQEPTKRKERCATLKEQHLTPRP
jgi:hypothetical protein